MEEQIEQIIGFALIIYRLRSGKDIKKLGTVPGNVVR